jgi:hypothetical protein
MRVDVTCMQVVQDQIQQVKDQMKGEHEKSLQADCQRSTKAVEGEKKKMRKLVKALAIREKKLLFKAERDSTSTGTFPLHSVRLLQ